MRKTMVFDCFTFFNELDLLEIRLNELAGIVDRIVIVESTRTFSGQSKRLYYAENRDRYKRFADRIIHVVVDDMPPVENGNRWELERHQRRKIIDGLHGCSDLDIIIVSDVDEVPSAEILSGVLARLNHASPLGDRLEVLCGCLKRLELRLRDRPLLGGAASLVSQVGRLLFPRGRVFRFLHKHYEYFLNGYVNDRLLGASVMRASTLKRMFGKDCDRTRRIGYSKTNRGVALVKGGWHFSYLGGEESIIAKIEAFSHSEYDKEEFKDRSRITGLINRGENLFGRDRSDSSINYCSIDRSYPKYLFENQQRFSHLIWQASCKESP